MWYGGIVARGLDKFSRNLLSKSRRKETRERKQSQHSALRLSFFCVDCVDIFHVKGEDARRRQSEVIQRLEDMEQGSKERAGFVERELSKLRVEGRLNMEKTQARQVGLVWYGPLLEKCINPGDTKIPPLSIVKKKILW